MPVILGCLYWVLLVLLAPAVAPAAAATPAAANRTGPADARPVRFFIDEGFFLEGDTEILRAYIAASKGRMELSGESSAAFLSFKGYYVPDKWDVYWSTRAACQQALRHMKPGQLANCVPGAQAMALKRDFVTTWQQAYGEAAFSFFPRSYLIPQQYWLWRSLLLAAASPADSLWVLKADLHRGQGVAVLPQQQALSEALALKDAALVAAFAAGKRDDSLKYRNILVQQYLQPQMVIAGRSSYIRMWMLITSISPLRAYLFKGGIVVFGKQKQQKLPPGANATVAAGNTSSSSSKSSSSDSDSLIVNLWIQDRDKSAIWGLQELEQYFTDHPEEVLPLPAAKQQLPGAATTTSSSSRRRTFADAWADMQTSASLMLAAALPAMRAAAKASSAPESGGLFEYFGIDFVMDASLRPWMIEVNAGPSMARRKKGACVGKKATASCRLKQGNQGNSSNSSSSSNSTDGAAEAVDDVDGFDIQKEHFIHDMLAVLGLPVDAAPAAADSSSLQSGGLPDGLSLLHQAAAVAAGQASNSSSSSGPPERLRALLQQPQQDPKQQQGTWWQQQLLAWQRRLQQMRKKRTHRRRHHHRRHTRAKVNVTSAAATAAVMVNPAGAPAPAAASASAAEQAGPPTVLQQPPPAAKPADLPPGLLKLLCPFSSSAGSSSSGSQPSAAAFACVDCLTAADLKAIAAAEFELQRSGRFEAVYDVIPAHMLNSRAAPRAAAATAAATRLPQADASSSVGGRDVDVLLANAADQALLSQERSVWDKLYHSWKGLSTQGLGVSDLAAMKHYTTDSAVSAPKKLQLDRQDYLMSAWLRVRQQVDCSASAAAGDDGTERARSSGAAKVFGSRGDGAAADVGNTAASRECMLRRLDALVHKCQLEQ